MKKWILMAAGLVLLGSTLIAQRWSGGRGGYARDVRTARSVPQNGALTPEWSVETGFEKDVFTFVRVRYDGGGFGYGRGAGS